eukprot:gene16485-22499_t
MDNKPQTTDFVLEQLIVTSIDIDMSKVTTENIKLLYEAFPPSANLDGNTLARFLIARDNDVAKATVILSKYLEWKSSSEYPVLKENILDVISQGRLYIYGEDKDRHPLLIWNGKHDGTFNPSFDQMRMLFIWWADQAMLQFMPKERSKVTILMIDAVDHGGADSEFMKYITTEFQDRYPERLNKVIVYPCHMWFYGFWNIVKLFVDPITREKMVPTVSTAGIEEYIDKKFIPMSAGGDCNYIFNEEDFPDPFQDDRSPTKALRSADFDDEMVWREIKSFDAHDLITEFGSDEVSENNDDNIGGEDDNCDDTSFLNDLLNYIISISSQPLAISFYIVCLLHAIAYTGLFLYINY